MAKVKEKSEKTSVNGNRDTSNPIITTNNENKTDLIWNIATHLGGLYKPHKYDKVIIPFTVIKRFNDTILLTRKKVLDAYEKHKKPKRAVKVQLINAKEYTLSGKRIESKVMNNDDFKFFKVVVETLLFDKKGDLVLSEGGEVGKTCLWNAELDECHIQNFAHKVTVNKDNNNKYYLYLFFVYGVTGKKQPSLKDKI